mmetsp:Transcript_17333/g.44834  ORF Transcript_17333/g.44834 Transcript_17333/m.44834 type:complete len:257 (-) Transcript_17333:121-891(-)
MAPAYWSRAFVLLCASALAPVGALLPASAHGVTFQRYRVQRSPLRMAGDESPDADPQDSGVPSYEQAPASTSRPGAYDVSKLAPDGGGFNKFDPVLTASTFVSRRFGIVGGLALVGLLAATEGSEIVKSFMATGPIAGTGEVVDLGAGLTYVDELVGTQGDSVLPGNIVGFHAVVSIGDTQIFDTHSDKPVAYTFGKKPYPSLVCAGVEQGIRGMKVGGKRRLSIPQALAPEGVKLPSGVDLTYEVELTEILTNYF